MTYFEDMSSYNYARFKSPPDSTVLNVGWLDSPMPFNRGAVQDSLIQKLIELCRTPVNRTRGWHSCSLCDDKYRISVDLGGEKIQLGNGEIRVRGKGRTQFASPTLIVHYITDHEYRPPDEFLDALRERLSSVCVLQAVRKDAR